MMDHGIQADDGPDRGLSAADGHRLQADYGTWFKS